MIDAGIFESRTLTIATRRISMREAGTCAGGWPPTCGRTASPGGLIASLNL